MPIIKLDNIHKTFGQDKIFAGLNLQFYRGEKVGIIGANGCGKTTILRMILGTEIPDVGQVIKKKSIRVGYLPQEPHFNPQKTVLETIAEGLEHIHALQSQIESLENSFKELTGNLLETAMNKYTKLCHDLELAGGYDYQTRIKSILAGLGLETDLHDNLISTLSGGQLARVSLAKALFAETDALLLDEPTNHLDLEAVLWLEKFLRSYSGAVIIISHDRYLLNTVTDKIIEVSHHKATSWKGNYSKYLQSKAVHDLQMQRKVKKTAKQIAESREFIAKNRNFKGMQGTARARAKQLDKTLQETEGLELPKKTKTIHFQFNKINTRSKIVLKCEALEKTFDDLTLFKDLSFELFGGESLGITGPNGTGKSTFLKIAMGQEKSTNGSAQISKHLSIGYLDQHAAQLNPNKSVLEELSAAKPDMSSEELRSKLGAFLFSGDDVFKKISMLSGGEQNRLMLCKLVVTEPDVLVLDEPTNHLDIASREMLETALKNYQGSVIVVSHDRYFLDRVVDSLLVVGVDDLGKRNLGGFEMITGIENTYSRYVEKIEQRRLDAEAALKNKKTKPLKPQQQKPKTAAPPELKRFNKFKTDELEEMILTLEEQIENDQAGFSNEDIYKDHHKIAQLKEDIATKQEELELLYKAYGHREK